MQLKRLDNFEFIELAAAILGIDEDTSDDFENEVEQKLADEDNYNISIESFSEIAQKLFDMIGVGVSPLNNQALIGFSIMEKKFSRWVVKKNITSEFIGLVIQWLCENEPEKITEKGFLKEVTIEGKVEYELIIRKPKAN